MWFLSRRIKPHLLYYITSYSRVVKRRLILRDNAACRFDGEQDWSTATDRALNPYKLPTKLLPSSVGGNDGSAAAAAATSLGAAEERKHLCLYIESVGFPACLHRHSNISR